MLMPSICFEANMEFPYFPKVTEMRIKTGHKLMTLNTKVMELVETEQL